jgi:hypothetical protein
MCSVSSQAIDNEYDDDVYEDEGFDEEEEEEVQGSKGAGGARTGEEGCRGGGARLVVRQSCRT